MIGQLAEHTDIRAALVMGGLSLSQQAAELRQAPEIVVATPGRIIDHVMNTMAFELDTLSALVLDEADRLLEMGFQDEVVLFCFVCHRFCHVHDLFKAKTVPAIKIQCSASKKSYLWSPC